MRSRSVSNNGGSDGISVCITKGTTRVNLFYMNTCIFANQRFDTFWTHVSFLYSLYVMNHPNLYVLHWVRFLSKKMRH
jgi:hypothetical protein